MMQIGTAASFKDILNTFILLTLSRFLYFSVFFLCAGIFSESFLKPDITPDLTKESLWIEESFNW